MECLKRLDRYYTYKFIVYIYITVPLLIGFIYYTNKSQNTLQVFKPKM